MPSSNTATLDFQILAQTPVPFSTSLVGKVSLADQVIGSAGAAPTLAFHLVDESGRYVRVVAHGSTTQSKHLASGNMICVWNVKARQFSSSARERRLCQCCCERTAADMQF